MTTEDEAFTAVGCLSGAGNYTDDQVMHFAAEFQKRCDDGEILIEVCERIGATWTDTRNRPTLGIILDEYRRHPVVAAEREARVAADLARRGGAATCGGSGWVEQPNGTRKPCNRCNPFLASIYSDPDAKWDQWLNGKSIADLHDDLSTNRSGVMSAEYPMPSPCRRTERPDPLEPVEPPRVVSVAEGLAIANAEHRSMYGRDIGETFKPNAPYAQSVIENMGTFDPVGNVWRVRYSEVAEVFRFDHARCRASLLAIGSRRLAIDNQGNIVMKLPDEPADGPDLASGGFHRAEAPQTAPTVPGPADGDPDAVPSIGAGIAETIRRLGAT